MPEPFSRRRFIGTTSGVVASTSLANVRTVEAAPASTPGTIPQRKFGRHADMISALGLGGHHLGDAATVQEATAIVDEAVDGGVTFFDNAWEYNNHQSEQFLGAALRGGYRERVFLMTKVCTHGRDAVAPFADGPSRSLADPRSHLR